MALDKWKDGNINTSMSKDFIANEGDELPNNTNKLKGLIKSGSTVMILMDDDTIVTKIFNAKYDRWIVL